MTEIEMAWIAGLLEGEGSFLKPTPSDPTRPIISMVTTDEDVAARVAKLLGVRYRRVTSKRYLDNGWKVPYQIILRGHRAAEIMQSLFLLMGKRRQSQIERALCEYRPRTPSLISEEHAIELAKRYWSGDRRPTALGKAYGLKKNAAIYYINKYAADARVVEHLPGMKGI